MKTNRVIAQVESMLRTAIENNEFEAPLRLQGLLFLLQRDYIRELEATMAAIKLSESRKEHAS